LEREAPKLPGGPPVDAGEAAAAGIRPGSWISVPSFQVIHKIVEMRVDIG